MANLVRTKVAFIKQELTFGTEAGNTNGSDMIWAELMEPPTYKDELVVNEVPVQTGKSFRTPSEPFEDGATLELKIRVPAMRGAGGAGVAPPARDYLDLFLENAMGFPRARNGHTISTSATGTMSASAGGGNFFQDVVGVYSAGSDRLQTAYCAQSQSAGTFGILPNWFSTPVSGSTSYARRIYTHNPFIGVQLTGSLTITLSGATQGGLSDVFTFRGCRATGIKLDAPTNKEAVISISLRATSKTEESAVKTSLPAITGNRVPFVKSNLSPVYLNNVLLYGNNGISVDFGLRTQEISAQEGANGRADIAVLGMDPVITATPIRQNAWVDAKRTQDATNLLVQLGSGVPATFSGSTYVPAMVITMNKAQITEVNETADGNISRQGLTFKPADEVSVSGSITNVFQIVRF